MGRTDVRTDGQGDDYMLPRNFSGSIKRVEQVMNSRVKVDLGYGGHAGLTLGDDGEEGGFTRQHRQRSNDLTRLRREQFHLHREENIVTLIAEQYFSFDEH